MSDEAKATAAEQLGLSRPLPAPAEFVLPAASGRSLRVTARVGLGEVEMFVQEPDGTKVGWGMSDDTADQLADALRLMVRHARG